MNDPTRALNLATDAHHMACKLTEELSASGTCADLIRRCEAAEIELGGIIGDILAELEKSRLANVL